MKRNGTWGRGGGEAGPYSGDVLNACKRGPWQVNVRTARSLVQRDAQKTAKVKNGKSVRSKGGEGRLLKIISIFAWKIRLWRKGAIQGRGGKSLA